MMAKGSQGESWKTALGAKVQTKNWHSGSLKKSKIKFSLGMMNKGNVVIVAEDEVRTRVTKLSDSDTFYRGIFNQ
jgi:hypothetical protein